MSAVVDDDVDYLIIGAGMSGLGFAHWARQAPAQRGQAPPRLLVVEAQDEPGGYCRTVARDGFTWDYSGHFFHFRDPSLLELFRSRLPEDTLVTVSRRAKIRYRGRDLDYPFQANIHQLPRDEFLECLADFADAARHQGAAPSSLSELLVARLGRGICERFLVPYNEKLYACSLDELDPEAMGRFFPRVDFWQLLDSLRPRAAGAPATGYNATFVYPRGGAAQLVRALADDLAPAQLALSERLLAIDVRAQVATTTRRRVRYRHLVSSAPLPALLAACGRPAEPGVLRANAVAVYNLGFDRKGRRDVHWMYFPARERCFYRVGWYDNLLGADRQSLYVELGLAAGAPLDVEATLERVLADLRAEGIIVDHRLLAWHHVRLEPAYVHLTRRSIDLAARARAELATANIHSIGRYGGWTYCSIEDNLIEARALAAALSPR